MKSSQTVNILFGPPICEKKGIVLSFFFSLPGIHILCGGTTSNIVSDYLNEPIDIDLIYVRKDVPPIGQMKGVDLVTEGIITLTRVRDMLKNNEKPGADGASLIYKEMLRAEKINFVCGLLSPEKEILLSEIIGQLKRLSKQTETIGYLSLL